MDGPERNFQSRTQILLLESWKLAVPVKTVNSAQLHDNWTANKARPLTFYSSSVNSDYRQPTNSEMKFFKSMQFRFCCCHLRLYEHKSEIPPESPTLSSLTFSAILKFLDILFKEKHVQTNYDLSTQLELLTLTSHINLLAF